jgi:hypothetical protein
VSAEILVRMGAMSMTFTGTVEIVEQDTAAHRTVPRVESRLGDLSESPEQRSDPDASVPSPKDSAGTRVQQ